MITAVTMLQMPLGTRLAIVRPEGLLSDWRWQIRERDNPAVVKDTAVALILNATRHVFVLLDSRYEPDVVYEIRIFNDAAAEVASGTFQCYRAAIGPLSAIDFAGLNAQLRLIAGLQGLNSRWVFHTYDAATGIPMSGTLTIYGQSGLSKVLAIYKMRRRLNKVRQVIGEIMFQTYYDPTAILEAEGTGA